MRYKYLKTYTQWPQRKKNSTHSQQGKSPQALLIIGYSRVGDTSHSFDNIKLLKLSTQAYQLWAISDNFLTWLFALSRVFLRAKITARTRSKWPTSSSSQTMPSISAGHVRTANGCAERMEIIVKETHKFIVQLPFLSHRKEHNKTI